MTTNVDSRQVVHAGSRLDQILAGLLLGVGSSGILVLSAAVNPVGGDDTLAVASAFAYARDHGLRVVDPGAHYRISGEITIDWPGFHFEGVEGRTVFELLNDTHGFLKIAAEKATVKNFRVEYNGTRQLRNGSYFGYTQFQRFCAVEVRDADRCTIENVESYNLNCTVVGRGKIVRRDGTTPQESDGPTALDFRPQIDGLRIKNIRGESQDFVLTGGSWKNFEVDGVRSNGTTMVQDRPPHAIYCRTNGSGGYEGYLDKGVFKRLVAINNPYSDAFKIHRMRDCLVEHELSTGTVGGFLMSYSDRCTVRLGTISDQVQMVLSGGTPDDDIDTEALSGAFCIRIAYCNDIEVEGGMLHCRAGFNVAGATAFKTNRRIRYKGLHHVALQTFPADVAGHAAQASFRADNDSQFVTFESCKRTILAGGPDKEMFVASGTSILVVEGAESRGGNTFTAGGKFCAVGDSGVIKGAYDSTMIEGWEPSTNPEDNLRLSDSSHREELSGSVTLENDAGTTVPLSKARMRWYRRGSEVWGDIRIALTGATGLTGTDDVYMGGLPFDAAASGSPPTFRSENATETGVTLAAGERIEGRVVNPKRVKLERVLGETAVGLTMGDLASGATFQIFMRYETTDGWGAYA